MALNGSLGRKYCRAYPVVLPLLPALMICLMIYLSGDPGSGYYAGLTRWIFGRSQVPQPNSISMIMREPVGVVGVISPWNFPFSIPFTQAATAVAAGNAVVVKPSELTPSTTVRYAELVADLLPPGTFNVLTGHGSAVGEGLADRLDRSR